MSRDDRETVEVVRRAWRLHRRAVLDLAEVVDDAVRVGWTVEALAEAIGCNAAALAETCRSQRARLYDRRSQRLRRREIAAGQVPMYHGTSDAANSGCGCERCESYRTRRREARRAKYRRGLPPDDPRHGTVTGAGGYGCRCDACRAAERARRAGLPPEKLAELRARDRTRKRRSDEQR